MATHTIIELTILIIYTAVAFTQPRNKFFVELVTHNTYLSTLVEYLDLDSRDPWVKYKHLYKTIL